MAKPDTEMLKGVLEGIVSGRAGEEPGARSRDHRVAPRAGLHRHRRGTVYALLVRIEQRGLVEVEKVPSSSGPPRKVYSPTTAGRERLADFWRTWSFLSNRIEQLRDEGN